MGHVRRASASDLATLTRLRLAAVAEAHPDTPLPPGFEAATRAYLGDQLAGGGGDALRCWVADVGGTLAATASLVVSKGFPTLANPGGLEGYVSNVYTDPAHRRSGLAGTLLRALVEDAGTRRIGRLWIYPTPASRGLYERTGFEVRQRGEPEMELVIRPRSLNGSGEWPACTSGPSESAGRVERDSDGRKP
jgi:ribosomal protein S18 acetylase RimI-like enzyme